MAGPAAPSAAAARMPFLPLDHVKDREARGRFAIGAQHKVAGVDRQPAEGEGAIPSGWAIAFRTLCELPGPSLSAIAIFAALAR